MKDEQKKRAGITRLCLMSEYKKKKELQMQLDDLKAKIKKQTDGVNYFSKKVGEDVGIVVTNIPRTPIKIEAYVYIGDDDMVRSLNDKMIESGHMVMRLHCIEDAHRVLAEHDLIVGEISGISTLHEHDKLISSPEVCLEKYGKAASAKEKEKE